MTEQQNIPDLPGLSLEEALKVARLLNELTGDVHGATVERDDQTGYTPLSGDVWKAVRLGSPEDLATLRKLII